MKGVFTNASAISIIGNDRLCGGIFELQLPNCITQKTKHKIPLSHILPITIASVLVGGTRVSLFIIYCFKKKITTHNTIPLLKESFLKISYEKLFKATDGFSSTNLIGFGSFCSEYKGILDQDGEFVAFVKVLNLQNCGATKRFMAECKTLRNIQHQNLPSNILLDHDMVARVGDFGLARFCPELTIPNQSSSNGIRGSIGYVPLEYGYGSEMSTSGDVYSYGIILLEIITGKTPTDSMFEEGLNLHSFARIAFPDHVMEIVDPVLLDNDEEKARAIAATTTVGARTWESIQ
ncbi:hypothetical protein ACSBR1_007834 [Camellia fascicularis]